MMQRLRISSDLLIIATLALGPTVAMSSTVVGKIEVLNADRKSSRSSGSASDVVVWLTAAHDLPSIQPEHVRLIQRDKMFHPHTLVIPVGSTVDFPNDDPIYHNAFSNFDGQIFDIGLYAPGTSKSEKFSRAGVVRVFCDIHPSMSALIVVVDTPFFTKAGHDGRYQFANVPAGAYEVHVFDERDTKDSNARLTISVSDEERCVVPQIRLSEAGYVQAPHKNKYGLDYPPNANDDTSYVGLPQ